MPKLIGNQMAEKLRKLLDRETGRLTAEIPPPPHREWPTWNWQHVLVTSGAVQTVTDSDSDSDGLDMPLTYYSGRVEVWNAKTREVEVYGDVWVIDLNDAAMTTGTYYTCRQSGNLRLHVACREQQDSDSDSDSEALCSDSDGTSELRPLFVHGSAGACGTEIEVELPTDICLIVGTPPAS